MAVHQAQTADGEDAGHNLDNIITLGGVRLPISGPAVGASISEFSSGLKIGKATYDEREHAFWFVLDDFSGGLGHRTLDVREALGTHWDNVGGIDLRRTGHVTLPPKRFVAIDTSSPSANPPADNQTGTRGLFFAETPHVQSTVHDASVGFSYFGAGGAIYTVQQDANTGQRNIVHQANLAKAGAEINRLNRIIQFQSNVAGSPVTALYACGDGSIQEYFRSLAGDGLEGTWVASSDLAGIGTTTKIWDMIVFEGAIIGQVTNNKQITSSADGIAWAMDDSATDPIYSARELIKFIGIAMAPWGDAAPYFLEGGKLYVLDVRNKQANQIQDVGDMTFLSTGTVWGGSVYVSDGRTVFTYNPGMGATVRNIGPFGKEGIIPSWGDGSYSITHWLPGTSTLFAVCRRVLDGGSDANNYRMRLMCWNGAGWSWFAPEVQGASPFTAFIDKLPLGFNLSEPTRAINVVTMDGAAGSAQVSLHYWRLPVVGDIPYVSAVIGRTNQQTFFENGELNWETGWIDGGFADLEGAAFRMQLNGYRVTENETLKVEYRLNNDDDAAYNTLGTLDKRQQTLWFDKEHEGLVFKTIMFRFSLNRETVADVDSTATVNDADFNNSEVTFTSSDGTQFAVGDIIAIDNENDDDREQMLITNISTHVLTIVRGWNGSTADSHVNGATIYDYGEMPSPTQLNADSTIGDTMARSPEINSMIFVYNKRPDLRMAWTLRVDISRMIAANMRTGANEDAAFQGVFHTLRALYNTKHLLKLQIPSIDPDGFHVLIADMPITVEDFRDEVAGRGFIDIQCLEPVT